ncbi:MAG: helix-turn-helix domain-containing protein [Polyangiaceae bacterium]
MTHEFLSVMLGVRRATVTEAARRLSDAKAIRYSRGRVQILNRRKLESLTCECYRATIDVFDAALNTWGGVALKAHKPERRAVV